MVSTWNTSSNDKDQNMSIAKQDRDSLIAYLTEHAEITLEVQPEDTEVRGNASAWGDGTDEAYADEIIARLSRGDEWAWCCVLVTATLGDFEGSDVLGGCSYESERDFRVPGGYFDDMKREAISALADQILEAADPRPRLPSIPAREILAHVGIGWATPTTTENEVRS